ncbi:MAG: hypothetical protein U0T73_06620 [Chitinophagales bacterium]
MISEKEGSAVLLIGTLAQPLQSGKLYRLSFKAKYFSGTVTSDSIAVGLTKKPPIQEVNYTSRNDRLLSNAASWSNTRLPMRREIDDYQLLTFEFKAKGSEKYIALGADGNFKFKKLKKPFGKFRNDNHLPFLMIAIDDVRVEPIEPEKNGLGKTIIRSAE